MDEIFELTESNLEVIYFDVTDEDAEKIKRGLTYDEMLAISEKYNV